MNIFSNSIRLRVIIGVIISSAVLVLVSGCDSRQKDAPASAPAAPVTSVGTEINVFNIRDDTNVYTRVYNLGTCSALTPDNVCRSISQPDPPPGGYVDYTLLPSSERPSTGTFVTIQEERPAARPIPSLSVPAMLLLGIVLAWLAWRNHGSRART